MTLTATRRHALLLGLLCAAMPAPSHAQGAPDDFYELESKYIFGFTTGSGIGLEGEKEFSVDTVAGFGRGGGKYRTSETELEFEHTPNQYIQVEMGALVSSYSISNVPGFDDRNQVAVSGAVGELRYLAVERGASSPFAVTLSVEPTWRRLDETTGERVTNLELETRLAADTELVANRLYLGFNLLYEPEWTRTAVGDIVPEATFGLSSALAFRPIPALAIGAEVEYFRHYDAYGPSQFTGDALYIGPTFYYQLTRKAFLAAAWSAQVTGRSTEMAGALNLVDFSHHRARLKVAVEF